MGSGCSKIEEAKNKKRPGLPKALTKMQDRIINKQKAKSLCQIITKDSKGNGFLCRIPDVKNPILITTNHVLGEKQIVSGSEINIYFTDENNVKIYKTIRIDETRTIYTVGKLDGENIDTTIIELRPVEDKLNDLEFLDLDEKIMDVNVKSAYKEKDIYVIYYKRGEKVEKSIGIINDIIKINKSYSLSHTCYIDEGYSGSPIILYNHKVIGLQIRDGKKKYLMSVVYYNILLKNIVKN